jgi:hypothetical protein
MSFFGKPLKKVEVAPRAEPAAQQDNAGQGFHVSSEWLELSRGNRHVRVYWRNGSATRAADLPARAEKATRFACISDTHGKVGLGAKMAAAWFDVFVPRRCR